MTKNQPQTRLFYDSLEDAIREVINVCGGPKAVGAVLWPAKSADAARTRLLDCLNPERAEKLSGDEILMLARMGRERGCYVITEYICAETGFAPPIPITADDERQWLQRRYIDAVEEMKRLGARMERLAK